MRHPPLLAANWVVRQLARIVSGAQNSKSLRTARMHYPRVAYLLAVLMCCASVLGVLGRPSSKAVDKQSISLETMVPNSFGEWRELQEHSVQVVNPQTKELLDKLYSQVLTRTYISRRGYRIMLSIAHGDDQRGGLQAHRPEVCYPAQGFHLSKVQDGTLATRFGDIDVRRLSTRLGTRNEPVTYWLTVGNQVVRTSFDKRLAELRLSLTGQIADGLLFRVSSLDMDEANAFDMQRAFIIDLMSAVPAEARRQLSGLRSGDGTS
jgi:EpsI family protein